MGSRLVKTLALSLVLLFPLAATAFTSMAHGGPSNLPIVGVWSPQYKSSNVTATSISPGSTIAFDVNVTNAPNFNAFELSLFYDPRFLTETSVDVNGTLFTNPFLVSQLVSTLSYPDPYVPGGGNRVERIQLIVVNLGPVPPAAGSGVLAKISFTAGFGATPLTLGPSTPALSPFSQDLPTLLAFGVDQIQVSTADGYFNNGNAGVGPVADFSAHISVSRELEFSFDGTASYDPDHLNGPNRGISEWVWDFGDGSNTTTVTPFTNHTYLSIPAGYELGNFSVRLTTVDNDGSDYYGMRTRIVEVPNLCPSNLPIAYVPSQCPTIKSAIDAVVPGGTVRVDPGNYSETLRITKPLTLLGAGPQLTVVHSPTAVAMFVRADDVRISGLKVSNSYGYLPTGHGYSAALSLEYSNQTSVSNSIFTSTYVSRYPSEPDYGIFLSHTRDVELTGNLVENGQYGITISDSSGTIMRDNRMVNNTYNFGVSSDTLQGYMQDVDTSNMVDGKPISYFVGATNPIVRSDSGYLGFVNSQDASLEAFTVAKVAQGVLVAGSSRIAIDGLNATGTEEGVSLFDSTGIRVENGVFGGSGCNIGGRIQLSSNNIVRNNDFSCKSGLEIQSSNNNQFEGNFIGPPPPFSGEIGVQAFNSTGNIFTGNEIVDFSYGLDLIQSTANTLDGNLFHTLHPPLRVSYAVQIQDSPRNTLKNNQISGALESLVVFSGYSLCAIVTVPCYHLEDYIQFIDPTNKIDGKPVYYIVEVRDLTLSGPAGYIAIVNSTRIKVQGVNLSYSGDGIQIISSDSVTVENSTISWTGPGIHSISSTELTLKGNKFSNILDFSREILIDDSRTGLIAYNEIRPIQGRTGIELYNSTGFTIEANLVTEYLESYGGAYDGGLALINSNNNLVLNNTFLGQKVASPRPYTPNGIVITHSQGNTLVCNTIARNNLGFGGSPGNLLYKNNFVNNTIQASGTGNSWNNAAGQGNYWSDYQGQDLNGDGIGDTLLPHLGLDNYPLMTPCAPTNTPPIAILDLYQYNATEVWVNAAASWDLRDPVSALQFRWDWEDDGVWDTPWSTNAAAIHDYSQPGAYTIRLEVMNREGLTATDVEQVANFAHDVAVTQIAPSSLSLMQGGTLTVNVQVQNRGGFFEHFNVTLYYDNNLINTQSITGLSAGDNQTLTFTWNTASVPLGSYTLKAVASTVGGETKTNDNTATGPTITIIPRDTSSPTWRTNSALGESQVSPTAITLVWTSAADNVAVAGYRIYENGQLWATVSGPNLTLSVSGLKPGTSYTFKVEAFDAAGNTSTTGPSLTITTPTLPPAQTPFFTQYGYLVAIIIAAAVVGSTTVVRLTRRKRSTQNR